MILSFQRRTMQAAKRKLDYADYAAIPDDGKRYEVIDGSLVVNPSPGAFHQRWSKRLQRQLEAFFETPGDAEVFNAPLDVILGPHDIVQPDIVVVTERAHISRRAIEHAPLLAVEVLSPSSIAHDRRTKFERYRLLGVRHYWILDGDLRRLECFRLEDGEYRLAASAEGDAPLTHPDFPGLEVTLADLWKD
jgi:Uma2 family endonuclease